MIKLAEKPYFLDDKCFFCREFDCQPYCDTNSCEVVCTNGLQTSWNSDKFSEFIDSYGDSAKFYNPIK